MLSQFAADYLQNTGWNKSIKLKACVGSKGNPIPWYTYPAIRMLNKLVKPEYDVFEYGAGNSSKWYSKKVKSLISVEHNSEWHKKVNLKTTILVPENSKRNEKHYGKIEPFYKLVQDKDLDRHDRTVPFMSYACEILNYDKKFDIVVVDGAARVLATWLAIQKVKDGGFIVFDNSDRATRYKKCFEWLKGFGFARIDFWGPGPLNPYEWCTSIFTKNIEIFK